MQLYFLILMVIHNIIYIYIDGGFLQGERDLLRDVFKIKLFCIMDDSAIISLVDECFNPVLEN